MKQNTATNSPGGIWPAPAKGLLFLCGALLILLATVICSGCSVPEKTTCEPAAPEITPEPPEFTYSVSISAVPIQISSGNLHWRKELPNESYTLEDIAIEIYNFGDFDILVTQLEIRVDEDTRLFNIDLVIAGGAKESISLQPMMEGYDGGIHRVYMTLLDQTSEVLYQNEGEDIGPLDPVPGTGSWNPVSS